MLAFALASLLTVPSAGEGTVVTLRPAVVVSAEEPWPAVESPKGSTHSDVQASPAPHLALVKAQPVKAKPSRARSTASPAWKRR